MPFLQKKPKVYNLRDRLTFGKHQGETLQDVIDDDPQYIEWIIENIPTFDLDTITMDYLEGSLDPFVVIDPKEYNWGLDNREDV